MGKRVLLLILGLMLVGMPMAQAITPVELQQADDTLRQMDSKISILRGYVQMAARGTVEGITLTSAQKQDLKDLYLAEKGDLVTLFNTLP